MKTRSGSPRKKGRAVSWCFGLFLCLCKFTIYQFQEITVSVFVEEDTIAAIATPVGEGGIAVIRISGPDAVAIADKGFQAVEAIALGDRA